MDRDGQSVPPAGVVTSALEKAERYWIGHCDYVPCDRSYWQVLSAQNTGELYRVSVSGRATPHNNWWDRLDCTCDAARKGMRVCWHKAAAWIHYNDARREVDAYRNND